MRGGIQSVVGGDSREAIGFPGAQWQTLVVFQAEVAQPAVPGVGVARAQVAPPHIVPGAAGDDEPPAGHHGAGEGIVFARRHVPVHGAGFRRMAGAPKDLHAGADCRERLLPFVPRPGEAKGSQDAIEPEVLQLRHHVGALRLKHGDGLGQVLRPVEIIVVEHGHEFAAGSRHRQVAAGAQGLAGSVADPDPGPAGGKRVPALEQPGLCIHHHHQFPVRIRLPQEIGQGVLGEILPAGHEGHGHQC